MGTKKSAKELAAECERRAMEVKSDPEREQLLDIGRRLSSEKSDERPGLVINVLLPDEKPTRH